MNESEISRDYNVEANECCNLLLFMLVTALTFQSLISVLNTIALLNTARNE